MTRTRRFLYGVGTGYLNQFVVMAAGLWLTPFFLASLGQTRYGLWLIAAQVLGYLTLLDLGIIVVLPRNLALAIGRANGKVGESEVAAIVGRTLPIVLLQTFVAAVMAVGAVLLLPPEWEMYRTPLIAVLITFVAAFPFRVAHAILTGLQDTGFLGLVLLFTWAAGTVITVVLLLRGHGLDALAAGWIEIQIASTLAWILRIAVRFPEALPSRLEPFRVRYAMARIAEGSWVSAYQIALVLITGADILLIGKLLGPAYVVVYAVTGKLVTVLTNQPQMLMAVALPGLAELRTSSTTANLMRVASALSQAMLLLSGLVFCVIIAINRGFVTAWVGPAQFGGMVLTALVAVSMLLRHLNTSVVYTIYSLGFEKRITLTMLADGVVTVASALILIPLVGMKGAAVALIIGVSLISLPLNLAALFSTERSAVGGFMRPVGAWAARFVPMAALVAVIQWIWTPPTLITAGVLAAVIAAVYALVMLPCVLAPPLRSYLPDRVIRLTTPLVPSGPARSST
jgi:O-antigen/teichoic acid export membrane protein